MLSEKCQPALLLSVGIRFSSDPLCAESPPWVTKHAVQLFTFIFFSILSLSVSDGAAGTAQLSFSTRRVCVYSLLPTSSILELCEVFFCDFCECERAVGSCGSWSRCFGVHSLSTMKQCCIFALKCVRFGLSLHWCVFFVWAILWAQSKQCVPPRLLKCTLRTTGGFNPQLELPFLLYLTYNELFSFSVSLFSPFHSHFITTRSVSDQEPGKLPVDDPSQRAPPAR